MGHKKKRSRRSSAAIRAELPVTLQKAEAESITPTKFPVRGIVSKKMLLVFSIVFLVGVSVYALVSFLPHQHKKEVAVAKQTVLSEPPSFDGSYIPNPLTYDELLKLSPELLDQVNVGLMDLLCSQGLPGSEGLKVDDYLNALSYWASQVHRAEDSNSYQYYQHPGLYRHSMAFFKANVMISALNDLGIHVDEQKSDDEPNSTFFAKSGPIFINGLLGDRHAGTCSSIPILIVALGQRLGYPIKLVCNSNHFFARWDDGKDRFNIEATNTNGGMGSPPDAYYHYWPRMMRDTEIAHLGYLQNMDGRHELAFILGKRLICLGVNGRKEELSAIQEKIKQLLPSANSTDIAGAFILN
jgi:hypothetical protein